MSAEEKDSRIVGVDAEIKPRDPIIDEKKSEDGSASVLSVDSREGDEALELVGIQRSAVFSEEYNLKLRRKLVCLTKTHS